jgi:hypothetical protein
MACTLPRHPDRQSPFAEAQRPGISLVTSEDKARQAQ